VNGSGRFLGLAQMNSEVEYRANFNYWTQNEKWKGFFFLNWLSIKDIPNRVFRHIINEYNENKPVTASRDTQEVHPLAGAEMLRIFSDFAYETSILDDFKFYEQKQENVVKSVNNINYNNNINFGTTGQDGNINNSNFITGNKNDQISENRNYSELGYSNNRSKMPIINKKTKNIINRVNSTDNVINKNVYSNKSEFYEGDNSEGINDEKDNFRNFNNKKVDELYQNEDRDEDDDQDENEEEDLENNYSNDNIAIKDENYHKTSD